VKDLLKGNIAIAKAAIEAGCTFYAGYPITPQNELTEYMSHGLDGKGTFIQAESELAAINMVFGASAAGARAMTSSSSPGISLKQEGISYIASAELPCVIVNMARGGPGLGNISGAQGDYFQATRGGGHGGYRMPVLGPSSVQELYDLTMRSFDLADTYRTPVMILGDGYLGQMMESLEIRPYAGFQGEKTWALTGCKGRKPNMIRTLLLTPDDALEKHNLKLHHKYLDMEKESMVEIINPQAELFLVAYGMMARIAKSVVAKDPRLGLIRPVTLWPFPKEPFVPGRYLVLEMSTGQMIEDVKLSLFGKKAEVHFYGRPGGMIPSEEEILSRAKALL